MTQDLKDEIDRWHSECQKYSNLYSSTLQQIEEYKEREAKLVEALRFYANESNWVSCEMGCGTYPVSKDTDSDEGRIAYNVLKELGIKI